MGRVDMAFQGGANAESNDRRVVRRAELTIDHILFVSAKTTASGGWFSIQVSV